MRGRAVGRGAGVATEVFMAGERASHTKVVAFVVFLSAAACVGNNDSAMRPQRAPPVVVARETRVDLLAAGALADGTTGAFTGSDDKHFSPERSAV